ncbi:MAG TPA: NAD(P)H-hydrate dehydratase [Spirochaetota bacterium]|nr:NAD(P)H-hydrate dehydratase [Spirochaetota bacterium]
MKVVYAEEMQRIDRYAIETMGIPGEVLMGFAGKAAAEIVTDYAGEGSRVAVVCGCGNNGGDGFVIAYLLRNSGYDTEIFLAGAEEKISPSSRIYYNVCVNSDIPLRVIAGDSVPDDIDFSEFDIVVDSMFGTGFTGSPRGAAGELIALINRSGSVVISIDLPSGLPSNGGSPEGAVVQADCTVTMGLPKLSCVTYPGLRYTGDLHVADIGFPAFLTESDDLKMELVDDEYARQRLGLRRETDTHKGAAGHLLLVGGFDGMEGAIMLSAMAAFETGVGLGTLLTTGKARSVIAGKIPELITASFPDIDEAAQEFSGIISDGIAGADEKVVRLYEAVRESCGRFFQGRGSFGAMLIGPGMGRSILSAQVFTVLMNSLEPFGIERVLVDGDGLYHLAEYLKKQPLPECAEFILTPHFLEASRLSGESVDVIKKNRPAAAMELGRSTGATVLLKGPATLVSDGVHLLINTTGNPALATAGSGDVLSGIIASLMLRDLSLLEAGGIGAFLHGRAADLFVADNDGIEIMKSSDTIGYIREAAAGTGDEQPDY